MAKLLVIDDEPLILDAFEMTFPDHEVLTATYGEQARELFESERPDVVLSDVRLPDINGLELFKKLHAIDGRTPIILMTGKGTAATAIEAMQLGAFEYVLKPLDPDMLVPLVESAIETNRIMRVPACLPGDTVAGDGDQLIGNCPSMQEVYRSIGRVASQDVTVLILGESGTGKEVIARAIYSYSQRSDKPFVAINCAAIPENLLESELFGHEKGSFTGADNKRIGKFEQCSGGTLFLDEIGDMPPLMQTKILRVLQDQTFERVGGTETIKTDVRIIAATNRDLEAMIETRDFRGDLFYRLNVYGMHLPPLRDRGPDVGLLAEHFCRTYARELRKELTGIAPDCMEILKSYRWPGNVREMQSVIKHALLEATGPVLAPAFLPNALRESFTATGDVPAKKSSDIATQSPNIAKYRPLDLGSDISNETLDQLIDRNQATQSDSLYDAVIDDVERRLISKILELTSGNQTEAAKMLGITRTTIRVKITKLGIGIHRVVE